MNRTGKRVGVIISLTMLIVMFATSICFGADTLKIVRTYPEDGAKGTTKDNVCVKAYFNNPVGNDASRAANKNKFKITDANGRVYPTRIYYNKKNTKYVLFVIDTNKIPLTGKKAVKDNMEYKAEISADFVDNAGHKLGNDPKRVITFKTLNQSRNTMIYMVMMFLMFGGMMFFSMRHSQNAKKKEEEGQKTKEDNFNPYREAKRTGKPVEEIIAEHQKEEAKKAQHQKKSKRQERKEEEKKQRVLEIEGSENFRVSRPRPIREAGCTFKTGRAAEAARREEEKARRKAELKATDYGKKKK